MVDYTNITITKISDTFFLTFLSLVAQRLKRLPGIRETQVRSLDREDPLEKKWQPTPVLLPEKSHGQRSLVGHSMGSQRVGHN